MWFLCSQRLLFNRELRSQTCDVTTMNHHIGFWQRWQLVMLPMSICKVKIHHTAQHNQTVSQSVSVNEISKQPVACLKCLSGSYSYCRPEITTQRRKSADRAVQTAGSCSCWQFATPKDTFQPPAHTDKQRRARQIADMNQGRADRGQRQW